MEGATVYYVSQFRRVSPQSVGSLLLDLWVTLHYGQGAWLTQTFYFSGWEAEGQGGVGYNIPSRPYLQ